MTMDTTTLAASADGLIAPAGKQHTADGLALAAVDLDGTLLGPDMAISPANRAAVAALQARGITVAIATGRHHGSAARFARQLPDVRWIVSAQGGEVSDWPRTSVLQRSFLTPEQLALALAAGRGRAMTAMIYTTDRILTTGRNEAHLAFYTRPTGRQPEHCAEDALPAHQVFKVVWIGDAPQIAALRDDADLRHRPLQVVQTHALTVELLPPDVTKASGLGHLAAHLGLDRRQVVAFGDSENDIPMFTWAGHSVAMPHGWPAALLAATCVGPDGPAEDAFARAVDRLLADGRIAQR